MFYLHSFGIVHRDLKPENVLMVENSESGEVKLIDFGLSKIIGPTQTCNEPYGTLSYVAPEVLLQKPYDKAVDVWSLGIILFLLLGGALPFDDDEDREIARQTIYEKVDFSYKTWDVVSSQAKDLITKMLEKDKKKRIKLEEVLQHDWITTNKNLLERRRNSGDSKAELLKAYTTTT